MSFIKAIGSLWRRFAAAVGRRKKPLLTGVGVLLVAVLAAQLLYSEGRVLPGARLNSQSVSGKTYDELIEQIQSDFESAKVTLQAGEFSETLSLGHIGAEHEAEAMVRDLTEYPMWQRFVPFSLVLKRPHVQQLQVTVSKERLEEVAGELAKNLSVPAEDARLTIAASELTTTPAKSGQEVKAEAIVSTLSSTQFHFGTTVVTLSPDERLPAVQDEDIMPLRAQAEEIIKRQIIIVAENGTEFKAEPTDITSWLTVGDSEEGRPRLQGDAKQLAAYARQLNDKVGIKAGTVRATLVDGEEKSRTTAPAGRAIASDKLVSDLGAALMGEASSSRIAIQMVAVPPSVTYDRSYTSSQKGLRAYIDYVSKSENIRVAVSQTRSGGWSAHGRAGEKTVAASTYKLYVAAMLFSQVKDGQLKLSDKTLDTDVAGCLERMIVVSDNPCAEYFVEKFGGGDLNSYLYSKGLSRTTTFVDKDAAQTTAGDLEKMLRGIENGSIVGGGDRTRLLDAMERQRYRAGVPAGSSAKVQNKVGFLWDYLNDAAIINHPKGTYVIAVMTKGSSWQRIAEITREVERIMYGG